MRKAKCLGVYVILLVWAGSAAAVTLYVDAAGGGNYTSIQAAIDAALAAGDVDQIEVAPGVYHEAINFKGLAVRLYGRDGAGATTIDGTGHFHVVQCVTGEGSGTVLEGFTITGGNANGTSPDDVGGGMYNRGTFSQHVSPVIRNCAFSGNSASFGGGMCNYYSSAQVIGCEFSGNHTSHSVFARGGGMHNGRSRVTVEDCVFSGNSTTYAGGGLSADYSNDEIINCTFSGNSSSDRGGGVFNSESSTTLRECTFGTNTAGGGAGMFNERCNPIVSNCTFDNNSASSAGGMYNNFGNPVVTDCIFSANSAQAYAGGMRNWNNSCPTVTNCTFSGNRASFGGGMHNYGSSPTISNCTFRDHQKSVTGVTTSYGAGMYNEEASSPVVTACMFSNNTANSGGGIRNSGGSNPVVTNCVFTNNSGFGAGMRNISSSPSVTNCTFSGNAAWSATGVIRNEGSGGAVVCNSILWGDSGGEIYGPASVYFSCVQEGHNGVGNISTDPLLDSSLHLSVNSPCIDAGDSAAIAESCDLDGNPRIHGVAVDMGAYEYTPTNTAPEIEYIYAPLEPVRVSTAVVVEASFSDADAGDSHIAGWNWGDGTSSVGTIDQINCAASGSHTYSAAGVYTITLTITDASNASDQDAYEFVVVYDPDAGFVTGGGWFWSAIGSYPHMSVEGKATFGFVSKYQKGAEVPTGNTQFQFKDGDLNFHSSSYDWLVVTGSDYAKFKGTGTVNGAGEYKFMLWAGDGSPDTFRVRIWTEDGGTEDVVYDNGFDQAIGGGSIVIHTK